uniref:ARAD1C32252p n=1 Tax=Blastobotrys adeninivorans TaxID=409370 RepID=A0A060T2X2_BLAAD
MAIETLTQRHWVDKNCLSWSKTYFDEKLVGITASEGDLEATISKVRSVDGDADVSQRKGKVICLFDLRMVLEYTGKTKDADSVSGTISIPEVAYDTEEDEYDFQISIDGENSAKEPIKPFVRSKIIPQLRKALGKFGPDLIETHGKDIQHPKGHFTEQKPKSDAAALNSESASNKESAASSTSDVVGTAAYNTTSVTMEPVFSAPAQQLYDAFLKPEMVAAWTRSKPDISPKVGSEYTLFNGNISGKILKLEEPNHISMTWRLRDWKQGHYANLDLNFAQGSGETSLKVNWTGIPIGQEEVVQTNFDEYYVKPIKLTFGFGTVL